jgi:hypothetical protein
MLGRVQEHWPIFQLTASVEFDWVLRRSWEEEEPEDYEEACRY